MLNDLYLRNTSFKPWLLINQKVIALNTILGVKCNHILSWWVCIWPALWNLIRTLICIGLQNAHYSFPKGCVLKINRKFSFPWIYASCFLFGGSYRFKKAFYIQKSRNQAVSISEAWREDNHTSKLLNSRLYQMNITPAVCS